jgi:alpha-tubulin suppressor-like RCC1 family protein
VLGLNDPVALAGGEQHSVAVEQGGTTGWGSNEDYHLGNDSNQSSSTPVQVLQSNPDQPLGDVVTVAARGDYSVAILAAGSASHWGGRHFG